MGRSTFSWPLFLFGLGIEMQIVSSLSFSELFVILWTPLILQKELPYMRRNGVMPLFWISLALVCGCVVACFVNNTPLPFVLRGLAVCCLMPCGIVVSHWLLRRHMSGVKWMLLGAVISLFLCTFVFQKSVDADIGARSGWAYGEAAGIMASATYWKQRIAALLLLIPRGWYLSCPLAYSALSPLAVVVVSMTITESGRGTALQAIGTLAFVIIGGKSMRTMKRIGRHFFLLVVMAVVVIFAVKNIYKIVAVGGWLGEKAQKKYEIQTKGDDSFKALLLGGRMESFCGLLACIDRPIVGFGPWAKDEAGYVSEFLAKYASREDYEGYLRSEEWLRKCGYFGVSLIPCHSVVTMFWLWYGIAGLIFCIYIMFVWIRYLRQDCWAVPQWYFWVAASIPGRFWDFLFNPLSSRVDLMFFVVACLLARAVRTGSQQLPVDMQLEIDNAH